MRRARKTDHAFDHSPNSQSKKRSEDVSALSRFATTMVPRSSVRVLRRRVLVQQRDQWSSGLGRRNSGLHDLFIGHLLPIEDGIVVEILPERRALQRYTGKHAAG